MTLLDRVRSVVPIKFISIVIFAQPQRGFLLSVGSPELVNPNVVEASQISENPLFADRSL